MHDFFGAEPTDTQVSAWAEVHALPILREQYEELRALDPPPGEERRVGRYLDLAEEGLAELAADPAALNRGDGLTPSLRRALDLAARLGFRECGQPIESEVLG